VTDQDLLARCRRSPMASATHGKWATIQAESGILVPPEFESTANIDNLKNAILRERESWSFRR
jgi:hypothetical protein